MDRELKKKIVKDIIKEAQPSVAQVHIPTFTKIWKKTPISTVPGFLGFTLGAVPGAGVGYLAGGIPGAIAGKYVGSGVGTMAGNYMHKRITPPPTLISKLKKMVAKSSKNKKLMAGIAASGVGLLTLVELLDEDDNIYG